MSENSKKPFFDQLAPKRDYWIKRNSYYYKDIESYCTFQIPPGSSVLEIGCGTGDLLASVQPGRGMGLDFSPKMLEIAQRRYPELQFSLADAEKLDLKEKFDFIIISDVIGFLDDIQALFAGLRKVTKPETRIIITFYNSLWEPILAIGEMLGLKIKYPWRQNWLPLEEIKNLLYLNDFEVIKSGHRLLFPIKIPFLSNLMNNYLAKLPALRKLCLVEVLIAKEIQEKRNYNDYTCSVIIPCRNEKGNIEGAVTRTPKLGKHTELIFVEGNSSDGTLEEIERVIKKYPRKDIKLIQQGDGVGKGDAVRKGFSAGSGDVLMILDADLTVPPEDLPKFFNALIEGKGEFINGTRLVYPMEKEAMRFLNMLGNKFFSMLFTYILEQPFKDTLCGTKVLFKEDYERIAQNRNYFGEFDPFGDFDLIFGASKLNLKIIEIPVRYRERIYGSTQISRFSHGWLLLKMSALALKKLKFV